MSLLTWGQRWVSRLDLVTTSVLDDRLAPVRTILENLMSATSDLLDTVAEGLTTLATPINDLMQENAAQAAKIAELEGSDVVESEAAGRVKSAFDNIAGKFTAEPSAPDVPPLPEVPVVDAPSDGSGSGDVSADPATGEDSGTV